MIIKAARFAAEAHRGQWRKYTEVPYIVHPMRVAGRLTLTPGATEEVVAAAWLHDVVEDCPNFRNSLHREFPTEVTLLVGELTNPSIHYPEFNRATRKQMDREHLARASYWAKVVKLVDRIDNLNDMVGAKGGFKVKYCAESVLLVSAVYLSDPDDKVIRGLRDEAEEAISRLRGTV